jgi:hypothetical protein
LKIKACKVANRPACPGLMIKDRNMKNNSNNFLDKRETLIKLIADMVIICRIVNWYGISPKSGFKYTLQDFIEYKKSNLKFQLDHSDSKFNVDHRLSHKLDQLVAHNLKNDAWVINLVVNFWKTNNISYLPGQRELILFDFTRELSNFSFEKSKDDKWLSLKNIMSSKAAKILLTTFFSSYYVFGFDISKSLCFCIDACILSCSTWLKQNSRIYEKEEEEIMLDAPPQIIESYKIAKRVDKIFMFAMVIITFFILNRFLEIGNIESFHLSLILAIYSLGFINLFNKRISNYQLEKLPVHIADELITEIKSHWPQILGYPYNSFQTNPQGKVKKVLPEAKPSVDYKAARQEPSIYYSETSYSISDKMKKIPKGKDKEQKNAKSQKPAIKLIGVSLLPCRLSITWVIRGCMLTVHGVFIKNYDEKISIRFYPHPSIAKVWSGYSGYDLASRKDFIYFNEKELSEKFGEDEVKPFHLMLQVAHLVPPENHHGLVYIKNDNGTNTKDRDFTGATYKAKISGIDRAGIFYAGKSNVQCDLHKSCQFVKDQEFDPFELLEVTEIKAVRHAH